MKINYYRYPSAQGEYESWQNCQFTHNTDLSPFTEVKPLVTLNGQPIIRQHHRKPRRSPDDTEYRFTIGDDNLPHEAQRDAPQPIPEGCDSSTSHARNQQETSNKRETINTSLTLPPHLPSEEPSRITRCQRVNKKSPVPHQPVKVLQSPASKVASRTASDSL